MLSVESDITELEGGSNYNTLQTLEGAYLRAVRIPHSKSASPPVSHPHLKHCKICTDFGSLRANPIFSLSSLIPAGLTFELQCLCLFPHPLQNPLRDPRPLQPSGHTNVDCNLQQHLPNLLLRTPIPHRASHMHRQLRHPVQRT
jgi:hypothetical protein